MSTEEKMTIEERYKYLRMMKKRYERANRQEKGNILNEMEVFTLFLPIRGPKDGDNL